MNIRTNEYDHAVLSSVKSDIIDLCRARACNDEGTFIVTR